VPGSGSGNRRVSYSGRKPMPLHRSQFAAKPRLMISTEPTRLRAARRLQCVRGASGLPADQQPLTGGSETKTP
jgi:hypothetical protein